MASFTPNISSAVFRENFNSFGPRTQIIQLKKTGIGLLPDLIKIKDSDTDEEKATKNAEILARKPKEDENKEDIKKVMEYIEWNNTIIGLNISENSIVCMLQGQGYTIVPDEDDADHNIGNVPTTDFGSIRRNVGSIVNNDLEFGVGTDSSGFAPTIIATFESTNARPVKNVIVRGRPVI